MPNSIKTLLQGEIETDEMVFAYHLTPKNLSDFLGDHAQAAWLSEAAWKRSCHHEIGCQRTFGVTIGLTIRSSPIFTASSRK